MTNGPKVWKYGRVVANAEVEKVTAPRRRIAHQGPEDVMSKSALICTILLAAGGFAHLARAVERTPPSPVPPNFAFPAGTEITFQWNYTCPDSKPCAFSCGLSNNVKALTLYLGTIPVGNNQKNSVIFYFYSTTTVPRNDGFQITGGPASTLACNVSGMNLDYSGPPTGLPTPPPGAIGVVR
jgi:hypothetical protein